MDFFYIGYMGFMALALYIGNLNKCLLLNNNISMQHEYQLK